MLPRANAKADQRPDEPTGNVPIAGAGCQMPEMERGPWSVTSTEPSRYRAVASSSPFAPITCSAYVFIASRSCSKLSST